MKNLIYICIGAVLVLFTSCEDFLDSENYTKKNTSNYPETLEDAEQMLTGIYTTLNQQTTTPKSSFFYVSQVASDDCLGGGAGDDKTMQALDFIMNYQSSMLEDFWRVRYRGIFRANMAIETLGNCEGYESEAQQNQMIGEAYFMRAFFYYEMASLFGQVPLITATSPVNLPKAEPDEIYAQIASDLQNAINLMPAQPYTEIISGHATKWAAEALMARVFLFYTGFYEKSELPLPGEEGTISKSQVVSWLEDCINNSGHTLVDDFRELWAYTNKYSVEDSEFTKGLGLEWAENDGAVNPETLFSIKYSNFADWGSEGYSNQFALYFGLRGGQDYKNTFPYGQGWGAAPVNPVVWNEWKSIEPNDMRRNASIIDLPNDLPKYKKGGWNDFIQETDYWQKKYIPVTAVNTDGSGNIVSSYSVLMYGTQDNYQLGSTMDIVLIRLADVFLMHSELTETNTYMNKVRNRAGLDDISYSLENIQNERRWELAFEGIRWNDIRRWGIAAEELDKQIGVSCYYMSEPTFNKSFGGGYGSRYNETKGFFPIPDEEISLSEGVLVQNDGWGNSTSEFTGW